MSDILSKDAGILGAFFGLFRHMTNRNLFYKIKLRHFLLLSNFAQKIRKNDPILSSRVASGRTDRRSNRTNSWDFFASMGVQMF